MLWLHRKFQIQESDTNGFHWKILWRYKKNSHLYFVWGVIFTIEKFCSLKSNRHHTLLISIITSTFSPVVLELYAKKQANELSDTWQFTNMINCFCCYIIISAGETVKKVLLSVIWNLLLIETNLSQIRTLSIKREKVYAVCPYFLFNFSLTLKLTVVHMRKK